MELKIIKTKRRFTMKIHLAVITICTLALANAVPAMPVYAASQKPAAAYSAKQRREGQKKIKDTASRIKSAFKKQDLNLSLIHI